MKKNIMIVGTIVILLIIIRFFFGGPEDSWICNEGEWVKHGNPSYDKPIVACGKKPSLPKTEKECVAKGGRWKKIGIDPIPSCNLKAKDQGNLCRDNSECEGRCQAELTWEEIRAGMSGKLVKDIQYGKCSAWVLSLGCQGVMERGRVHVYCFD